MIFLNKIRKIMFFLKKKTLKEDKCYLLKIKRGNII